MIQGNPAVALGRRLRRLVGPGARPVTGLVPRSAADRVQDLEDRSTAIALGPLARRTGRRTDPGVAVLSAAADHPLVAAVREVWPQARLTVVDPTRGEAETHVALAAAGTLEAIWDVEADERRPERVREVFPHLADGGVLVVLDAGTDAGAGSPAVADTQALVDLGATLLRAGLAPGAGVRADDVRLAELVDSVAVRGRHLVLTARTRGPQRLAKLREEEVADYLARTGERAGRVLLERPGSVVDSPAPVRFSESEAAPAYRTHFEAPPLQLREYAGATCSTGQVVTLDRVLLPETYRHNYRPRLGNRFTVEVAPRFARVKKPMPPEDLPGSWFHLDSEFRGHFGHAMTEQISRLWAWQEAKERYPDLKALMLVNKARTTIGEWEYRLYEAAGVAREDLVLFDHPVRPERLVAATPMFSQPAYVHDGIREVYRRIGDDLAADAPRRDYPERIFCSRRHEKRSATNTTQVEEFFAARGFEIVYPEDFPMAEQVQMFRSATDLAGFAGSAMFTMAFVPEPKRVILVSAETYVAQNEAMIAAVQGHQVNVAWCRPEFRRPDGTEIGRKLQARFTFDDAREGEFLRRVLDT
ncbi:glycosyltransferase 61 family protein [Nocardioides pantholopis]|uniref:glycosyltransferase 61 family protein n=1 Tax=Nocardioides pantholopis TaxID=2483798 RepID=UPI0013E2C02D|nr:glycosyltransferase 61 family protein [Nocardioides pantholopis]